MTMRRHADETLGALRGNLISMAAFVEEAVGRAIEALLVRDVAMAEDVIRGDGVVDRREAAIDERCLQVLALYQPEAGDLRFLTMAFRINHDVERVGDQAVNIAQRAIALCQEPSFQPPPELPQLVGRVQGMLRQSVAAFIGKDPEHARAVCAQDDEVDALDERIFRRLLRLMLEDYHVIPRALHHILVSRHLERVADHATNIAEGVIYLVEGRHIKHRWDEPLSRLLEP